MQMTAMDELILDGLTAEEGFIFQYSNIPATKPINSEFKIKHTYIDIWNNATMSGHHASIEGQPYDISHEKQVRIYELLAKNFKSLIDLSLAQRNPKIDIDCEIVMLLKIESVCIHLDASMLPREDWTIVDAVVRSIIRIIKE